ncbi:MAG: MFS transporter [Gammaproteobacteria bacterium]|nr:MFS transporter [Gammaproteobacteria bacterium]NNM00581.1 MFS transporter [Gammaproteobacteria bacterium]
MTPDSTEHRAASSHARGLIILISAAAVLFIGIGIRNSFGIFMMPVSSTFGWGRETFALAVGLQNLVWGLSQPMVGAVADRWGSGRVVAVSAAVYALGLALMAGVETPLGLNFSMSVLTGLALSGCGFPVILAAVGRAAPPERRSLYLGLASAGGSCGQLVLLPPAQQLIGTHGWSTTLLVFAVMTALMVPLAALLAGRVAAAPGTAAQHQTLRGALAKGTANGSFWLLNAGFFVCGFHVAFVVTHLPSYLADRGASAAVGAQAIALIGLGNVIGTAVLGWLGDRFRKKHLLSALYFGRAFLMSGFLLLPPEPAYVSAMAFLLGLLWLGTVPLTSGLTAELVGIRYMATLFGIVFLSHQVGAFFGAWYGGYIFDHAGSYTLVWVIGIVLALVSAALHLPIRDRAAAIPAAAV